MAIKANQEIRDLLEKKNIYQWQVAEKMNLNDSNFTKIFRVELSEAKRKEILIAIKEIENERMGF